MPLQFSSLLSCRLFRNKSSLAPIFYCFLQILSISTLVIACPYFIDFQTHIHILLFWLITCCAIALYFITHFMDPGYVPHDAVFFTDQEEFSHRNEVIWSVGSSRIPFSLSSNCDLASSSIVKSDRTGQKGTTLDLSKKALIDNSSSLINVGGPGFQQFVDLKDPEGLGETRRKESPTGSLFKLTLKELENAEEQGREGVDPIAECEASLEELDDLTQRGLEMLKLDSKLRSDKEIDISLHIGKKSSSPKVKTKNQLPLQSVRERPKQEIKMSTEAFYSMPTMCVDDSNQSRLGEEIEKENNINNEENVKREGNILDRMSSGNQSPPGVLCTDEGQLKFSKSNSSPQIEGDSQEKKVSANGVIIRPLPLVYKRELSTKEENEHKETTPNRINSSEAEVSMGMGKSLKKDSVALLEQSPCASLQSSINKLPVSAELKEEAIYVERRYCNVCNLDQPIRAKHCRDCNKCVAKYDHHCPWLGNCIGERNQLVFYWFLVFQIAEMIWAEIKLYQVICGQVDGWIPLGMLLIIPVTLVLVLVSILWLFHTYLVATNRTTWENVSWDKISYLKEWKSEWGSPFSQGLLKNIGLFCCQIQPSLRKWRLPKYKKTVNK